MAIILTVDDDPMLQRILGFMLKRNNHLHLKAFSVEEALDYLQARQVDMVILDLMMSEHSGMTLLEELRADKRYTHLPVVMLTANGHISPRVVAKEKGASAYLQKPISSQELTNTISEVLHYRDVPAAV